MTMGKFLLLYLKVDVCLLADVFQAFRRTCHDTYELDPAHYLTAPALALDAALKFSGVALNLLVCSDMVHFIERGIRGGIAQCSGRYAEANIPGTPNFDDESPRSCIVDIDANNLYGWAMSEPLPTGGFTCVPPEAWDTVGHEGDDYGYFVEVDFPEYPQNLRQAHEDLPLAPEHRIPPSARSGEKLLCTFFPKERYVLHYRLLELYRALGYRESRIHRVLRFEQEAWLAGYVKHNIRRRREASNEFERDFYKFMNNCVFGKFIENVRLRRRVAIAREWTGMRGGAALVASPQFHSRKIMDENRVIVELLPSKILLNKPLAVGATILDLAKYLMYKFHYGVIRRRLDDSPPKLLYTDTDSLIYWLPNMSSFVELYHRAPECFDTSNYPENHPLHSDRRRDVIGLFKDEMRGRQIYRFIGLRAKMYCLEDEDAGLRKRAKGLRWPVVRRFTAESYRRLLFGEEEIGLEEQREFRSQGHRVFTTVVRKRGLSAGDDKRFVCPDDPTRTLPWDPATEYMYLYLNNKL